MDETKWMSRHELAQRAGLTLTELRVRATVRILKSMKVGRVHEWYDREEAETWLKCRSTRSRTNTYVNGHGERKYKHRSARKIDSMAKFFSGK